MKLTIEAENACEIIDFLSKLKLEDYSLTSDPNYNEREFIDQAIAVMEGKSAKDGLLFNVFNKDDCLVVIQKNECLDVIWNDGTIGYDQPVKSINFDNVIAYR